VILIGEVCGRLTGSNGRFRIQGITRWCRGGPGAPPPRRGAGVPCRSGPGRTRVRDRRERGGRTGVPGMRRGGRVVRDGRVRRGARCGRWYGRRPAGPAGEPGPPRARAGVPDLARGTGSITDRAPRRFPNAVGAGTDFASAPLATAPGGPGDPDRVRPTAPRPDRTAPGHRPVVRRPRHPRRAREPWRPPRRTDRPHPRPANRGPAPPGTGRGGPAAPHRPPAGKIRSHCNLPALPAH
jgi:hypothetical protein